MNNIYAKYCVGVFCRFRSHSEASAFTNTNHIRLFCFMFWHILAVYGTLHQLINWFCSMFGTFARVRVQCTKSYSYMNIFRLFYFIFGYLQTLHQPINCFCTALSSPCLFKYKFLRVSSWLQSDSAFEHIAQNVDSRYATAWPLVLSRWI